MDIEPWIRLPTAFGVGSAQHHLALSETLLTDLDRPVLWWYSAGKRALVLGTSQKSPIVDFAACLAAGLSVYRRTSGGTAVLAEPNFLSLDVALPPGHPLAPPDVVETYHWLGQAWLEALEDLGLPGARLVTPAEVRTARTLMDAASDAAKTREDLARLVCYGSLSPYEVVVEGRKLVGLAQIRRRAGTLLQVGLPLYSQATSFGPLLALPPSQKVDLDEILQARLVGLAELLGRSVELTEVAQAFEAVLQRRWFSTLVQQPWPEAKLAQATRLEREKFSELN